MSEPTDDVKAAADRAEERSANSPFKREVDLRTPDEIEQEAKAAQANARRLEKQAREARARQLQAQQARQREYRESLERTAGGAVVDADSAPAEPAAPTQPTYEFRLGETDSTWPEVKRNGEPSKGSMLNACKAIEQLQLVCRRDTFTGDYVIEGADMGRFVGDLDDPLVRKFRELCFEKLDYEPGKEASQEALLRMCEENSFDSLIAQLDMLKWDGVPRLDTWLTTYLGVKDTPLHRAWGRLTLMAAIRRPYDPGCKFDHVLVLEGPEGADKSSVVKVLASGQADKTAQYFSDSPILHLNERDQQQLTKGIWFYEIAELAGMKTGDQHAIKRFITADAERARAAYDRFLKRTSRIPVFIGTFNTDADTGGLVEYLNAGDRRRWWPVLVGVVQAVDLAALKLDRWQLLAEAKAQHTNDLGEVEWKSLRLDPSLWADATAVQKDREHTSPISDRLSTLYAELIERPTFMMDDGRTITPGRDYIVSDFEVWVSAKLIVDLVGRLDPGGRKIAGALGAIGWKRVRDTRGGLFGGDAVRGYVHGR
jgi:hypothetical protein